MVPTQFLLARSNDSTWPKVFGHGDRPKALAGAPHPAVPSVQGLVRRQPVAEREERCLSVAAVDGLVGDAFALRARQPGRDERVRLRQLAADDHRSSRVEDRDALLHVLADVGELGGVVTAEGECRAVTLALGVWRLTAHPDADVAA